MIKTAFLLLWRQKSDFFINVAFVALAWLMGGLVMGETLSQGLSSQGMLETLFWIIFLFSHTLACTSFLKEDLEDGTITLLKTEPDQIDLFLVSRLSVLIFLNTLNAMLSLIILSFMVPVPSLLFFKVGAMLPGIVSLFLLIQVVCVAHEKASQLGPLLIWPLLIPFFICASQTGQAISPLWGLAGLSAFLSPLCFWGMRFSFRFL